jgi:hypothetical protein
LREGDPDVAASYYAFARVEKSVSGHISRVADARPVRFKPGARLEFADVPHGTGYTVVAELKSSADDSAPAKYFGRSKRFDLRAGSHVTVDVELELQPVPSSNATGPGIRIVEANEVADIGSYVRPREVTLALSPSAATRAVVANDANFTRPHKRALAELDRHGEEYWWTGWDLDADLCDSPPCPDGRREVHVEFYNDDDYRSDAYHISATLDTQAPALSNYKLSPEIATDGDVASLLVISREPLREAPKIRVSPADFELEADSERSDKSPGGLSFTYQYTVDKRAVDGRSYSIRAELVDLAGNEAEQTLETAHIGIEGELAAQSAVVERSPRFNPFERLGFFSRTDPVTGVAVTAVVKVASNVRFDTSRPPLLIADDRQGHTLDFEFDRVDSAEKLAVFRHTFSANSVAGTYALQLEWKDASDRRGKPELDEKIELRDAPDTATFGTVDTGVDDSGMPYTLYTSRPWGAQTVTGYQVLGDTVRGRVSQRATRSEDCIAQVLIYGDADDAGQPRAASLLAIANVDAATRANCKAEKSSFEIGFGARSGPRLYATPITASGYVGQSQRIVHGEWVATLAPGEQGGTSENPHALLAHSQPPTSPLRTADSTPVPADSSELPYQGIWTTAGGEFEPPFSYEIFKAVYDANHSRALFFGSTPDEQTTMWQFEGSAWSEIPTDRVTPLPYGSIAYDSAREELLLFGGGHWVTTVLDDNSSQGELAGLNETWTWDGRDWTRLNPAHVPPDDGWNKMVYDPARQKIVLVFCTDTWEWNGRDWKQVEPIPASDDACVLDLTYDQQRRKVVAIATEYDETTLTFESDGDGWLRRESQHHPPMADTMTLVYDDARGRSVLCEYDWTAERTSTRQTWEWNGVDWVFVETAVDTTENSAVLYDPSKESVVAFGGYPNLSTLSRLEEGSWKTFARTSQPSARSNHGMSYDTSRHQLVLFGGDPEHTSASDTWVNDGTYWRELEIGIDRAGSVGGTKLPLTYDAARQVSVLVSPYYGEDFDSSGSETLTFDGSAWRSVTADLSLPGRSEHALSYDGARQRVLLFGGSAMQADDECLGDTWLWDGEHWTNPAPSVSPPARARHALAYDSQRQRIVLFGGTPSAPITIIEEDSSEHAGTFCDGPALGDTWEWDGSHWENRSPVSFPPGRERHALAYDELRQRVVLFGGSRGGDEEADNLNDTWEWDGATWTQIFPRNSPSARVGHEMVYDDTLKKVVLFGGLGLPYTVFGDVWEWDGSNWTQRTVATYPQHVGPLAFNPDRDRVTLFSNDPTETRGGLWEWNGSTWGLLTPSSNTAPQSAAAMVFDPQRDAMLLVEPSWIEEPKLSTWSWDGASWEKIDEAAIEQYPGGLMHDDQGGPSLLVTGDQTYQMQQNQWEPMSGGGGPGPEVEVKGVAYDRNRELGLMLACEPISETSELWAWEDASWSATEQFSACGSVVYDSGSEQALVLLTSASRSSDRQLVDQVWLLDERGKREIACSQAPETTVGSLAYDSQRDQVVMVGNADSRLEEGCGTWLLSKPHPTQQIEIDVTSLAGPSRGRDILLDGFALRAVTGADAVIDGSPHSGVALELWDGLKFETALEHDAPVDSPQPLCFESADPATLNELETGNRLHFLLRQLGGGKGWLDPPRIATKSFEVRVRYHLPGAEPAVPRAVHTRGQSCDAGGWSGQDWLRTQ